MLPDDSNVYGFAMTPYHVLQLKRLAVYLTRTEFYKAHHKKCKTPVWFNALSPPLLSLYCFHDVTSTKIPNLAVGQDGKCLRVDGELLETNTQATTLLNSAC